MTVLSLRAAGLAAACSALTILATLPAGAAPAETPPGLRMAAPEAQQVIDYWTPARRAAAIPRDLVVDERGQGYLRLPDGTLRPHGRVVATGAGGGATPMAGPGGGDTAPPVIDLGSRSPVNGATGLGTSITFSVKVTDLVGVRSVAFRFSNGATTSQSFSATKGTGDVWSTTVSGFSADTWVWTITARDGARNTATAESNFSVGGGGGTGGTGIANEPFLAQGKVQSAAGRIYFEMPTNSKRTRWAGYVCSGTVVTEGTAAPVPASTDRSLILTAAHCIYEDGYKSFARNVLFIPDQDATGTSTDTNCENDRLGCWAPSGAVVDIDYTTRQFPDNHEWDMGFYVVPTTGAHRGSQDVSESLEVATGTLPISFAVSSSGQQTWGLGYSYSDDPNFMYCRDTMGTQGTVNWWLPVCGLSGGSSGGPWIHDMTLDGDADLASTTIKIDGTIMSVNSWGYTTQPGMAGPKLDGEHECVFKQAHATTISLSQAVGCQ
jgi:hypothetical protein